MFGGGDVLSEEAQKYINRKGINEGRIVLHSDLNNFFASVECLKSRFLKSYPVAVCGSVEERHGIVLAKNNIAKAYGIKTGQVIWQAKQKCPNLIVLEPNYEDYLKYSDIVRKIYSSFSDRVEPFGMDEAWLELTGINGVKTLEDGAKKANELRKCVYEETGLTVSVGVSDNKTFSKLASDYKKPDAVTVLGPDEYVDKISGLSLGEMIFAGRSTQKRLKSFDIETIRDIAYKDKYFFRSVLGKNGVFLYYNACGYDTSPVVPSDAPDIIKSIGNSATPPRDLTSYEDIKLMLHALCDKVCTRLRKIKMRATVLQIHVRDTKLNTCERQCRIQATDNEIDFTNAAVALYFQNFGEYINLRSIGVRAMGLIKINDTYQCMLFGADDIKEIKMTMIDNTVDAIREKFGKGVIKRGVLHTDKSLYSPIYSGKHLIQPFKSH